MRILLLLAAGCLAQAQVLHVDAGVSAPDGSAINGLKQSDFRVFDNGKLQQLTGFAADEPLDLVLLFEYNNPMLPVVQMAALKAHEALQQLYPGDRVGVAAFNSTSWVVAHFTDDLDAVEDAVGHKLLHERFGHGANLLAAVDEAALRLQFLKREGRRRAVLVITDDGGPNSRRESDMLRDFGEADAVLSALVIRNKDGSSPAAMSGFRGSRGWSRRADIDRIAEKTGGWVWLFADPGAGFQEAMHRIRNRYSLYYRGSAAEPHSIRVELTREAAKLHPGAQVRVRRTPLR